MENHCQLNLTDGKFDRKMEIRYKHKYRMILSKQEIRSDTINNGVTDMDSFNFFPFIMFRALLWGITGLDGLCEVDHYGQSKIESSRIFSLKLVTPHCCCKGIYFLFFFWNQSSVAIFSSLLSKHNRKMSEEKRTQYVQIFFFSVIQLQKILVLHFL